MAQPPIPVKQRGAYAHVITVRREFVATLRCRLMTEREIHAEMSNPSSQYYVINPRSKDNKPYSLATIHNDLVYLREQAIERAQEEFEAYQAMQLAEIREARKAYGWAKNDWKAIAKFLELEMRLLGTMDAGSLTFNQFNQQNNLFMTEEGEPKTVRDMTDEELRLIASQALPDVVEGELVNPAPKSPPHSDEEGTL